MARQMTSSEIVHPARDLAEEQRQYEQLQHRVQSVAIGTRPGIVTPRVAEPGRVGFGSRG